jgi:hypothetical protein
MIFDRLLVAAVCCWLGVTGLFPATAEPVKPLTPAQLQVKAKQKSISNVCKGKRKSKSQTVKDLCRRWENQNA